MKRREQPDAQRPEPPEHLQWFEAATDDPDLWWSAFTDWCADRDRWAADHGLTPDEAFPMDIPIPDAPFDPDQI